MSRSSNAALRERGRLGLKARGRSCLFAMLLVLVVLPIATAHAITITVPLGPTSDRSAWDTATNYEKWRTGGVVMRQHPNIRIAAAWGAHYLGGSIVPAMLVDNSRTMTGFTAASSYVGPVKQAEADVRPTWMKNLVSDFSVGLKWYAVPNTDLRTYLPMQPYVDRGMMNANRTPIHHPEFWGHAAAKFGDSGGAARQDGAWIFPIGDGGAVSGATYQGSDGWMGNDIVGISLAKETPAVEVLLPPTSFKRYWTRYHGPGDQNYDLTFQKYPANPSLNWVAMRYLSDIDIYDTNLDAPLSGVRVGSAGSGHTGQVAQPLGDPAPGHTYRHLVYHNGLDRLYRVGCGDMSFLHGGQSQYVDRWDWQAPTWTSGHTQGAAGLMWGALAQTAVPAGGPSYPAGSATPLDYLRAIDDPLTGEIYYPMSASGGDRIVRWNPVTDVKTPMLVPTTPTPFVRINYAATALDPIDKAVVQYSYTGVGAPERHAQIREISGISGTTLVATNFGFTEPGAAMIENRGSVLQPYHFPHYGFIYSQMFTDKNNGKPTFLWMSGENGDLWEVRREPPNYWVEKVVIADADGGIPRGCSDGATGAAGAVRCAGHPTRGFSCLSTPRVLPIRDHRINSQRCCWRLGSKGS